MIVLPSYVRPRVHGIKTRALIFAHISLRAPFQVADRFDTGAQNAGDSPKSPVDRKERIETKQTYASSIAARAVALSREKAAQTASCAVNETGSCAKQPVPKNKTAASPKKMPGTVKDTLARLFNMGQTGEKGQNPFVREKISGHDSKKARQIAISTVSEANQG